MYISSDTTDGLKMINHTRNGNQNVLALISLTLEELKMKFDIRKILLPILYKKNSIRTQFAPFLRTDLIKNNLSTTQNRREFIYIANERKKFS
jgi:hypothetical protein